MVGSENILVGVDDVILYRYYGYVNKATLSSYTFKLYFHATLSSYYVVEFKYSNQKSISVVLLNTHKIKDLFLIIVFLTE